MINISLKGRGSVGKAKWYDEIFKMAVAHMKGGFPLITFTYSEAVVGIPKVNF